MRGQGSKMVYFLPAWQEAKSKNRDFQKWYTYFKRKSKPQRIRIVASTIHINDLPKIDLEGEIIAYADNTVTLNWGQLGGSEAKTRRRFEKEMVE